MSRLTRDDWAAAALAALAEGGPAAVAVEPLAASLGATKGSFYWHFRARADLLVAALELWERRSTTDVIAEVEASGGTPAERIRMLFSRVFDARALTSADPALLSRLRDEPARAVVERVTRRRIDYVAGVLRESGLPARVARRRAAFAYSAFLGNLHLRHATPDLLRSSVGSLSTYADEVVALLMTR